MNNTEIQYDDRTLFMHIAQGDEPAFRMLFDNYRERLFAFVHQIAHSSVEAEEVVQEIFLKLWERRSQLADIEFPRAYIYTMARNRALDILTKISKNEHLKQAMLAAISIDSTEAEAVLDAKESAALIQAAVMQLTDKKRAIFQLSRDQGLNHQEIAIKMGISVQTVKNNLTEVLKFIKWHLSQHSETLAILFWLNNYFLLF